MSGRVLDPGQQKIIATDCGTHLVLAPPGCGKTTILSERVKNAINAGINPEDILCLTFTNRAARGMQESISRAGINTENGIFIGNTHRYCGRFLFQNNLLAKVTEILDEDTADKILYDILGEYTDIHNSHPDITGGKAKNRFYFLQHLMRQMECGMPKGTMIYTSHDASKGLRDLCAELGLPQTQSSILRIYREPERTITDTVRQSPYHSETIAYLSLAARYAKYKNRHRLLDFDDILIEVFDHLLKNPEHKRYRWIQVDEVQDLNPLQIAIIEELTAPGATVLYFGDEQQSIFSFMGASLSTLDGIRHKCGDNVHHLGNNYRSPGYILDMLNEYAVRNLDVERELLPKAKNDCVPRPEDMQIIYCKDTQTMPMMVRSIIRRLPDTGKTAVIVARNADADTVSEALGDIPHFKISGKDYFCSAETSTLLALASIAVNDTSIISWAKILYGTGIYKSFNGAESGVRRLLDAGICPSDFLLFESGTAISLFEEAFGSEIKPMVIFDTETSGLDTHKDDIIQIAAIKTYGGRITDKLNIFLETDKEIPDMLGDIVNPLKDEYQSQPHLPRRQGLMEFIRFARGCTLTGHNVSFDHTILRHNLRRDCGLDISETGLDHIPFDTLRLSRILFPGLQSFRLKDILVTFGLEGENSHLADDDIMATYSLCELIAEKAGDPEFIKLQKDTLTRAGKFRDIMNARLGDLYRDIIKQRDICYGTAPTATFIRKIADTLIADFHINLNRTKTEYFISYIQSISDKEPRGLREDLEFRMADLQTLREADLCDSEVIKEKVFITTLHKAKGLEFDNVIVYDVEDGIYPFFFSQTYEQKKEDARKLYVALSRSRKRLNLLVPYNRIITDSRGKTRVFNADLSPFIKSIRDRFGTLNKYD